MNGRTKGWWLAEKEALIEKDPFLRGLDVIKRRLEGASANAKFKANLLWTLKRFVSELDQASGFDVRTASADDICDYALGVHLCDKLSISVDDLVLTKRAKNTLWCKGLRTVADVITKREEDLLALPGFGKTSLREVRREVERLGFRLGMPLPEELPQ